MKTISGAGQKSKQLIGLYSPKTWKEKGIIWTLSLFLVTYIVIVIILGIYWSFSPKQFGVVQNANEMAEVDNVHVVPGYTMTATLSRIASTLLDKPGGYITNDVTPPGVILDNMPNWEFGVLVHVRDMSRAMRDDFSRSQSQSVEDKDLIEAEPLFNFNSNAWILPPTESQYRKGIKYLNQYQHRLTQQDQKVAQFYTRADNLKLWLQRVEKRLGSLSQRLSASVGQDRINTDLAGDSRAQQSTSTPSSMEVKTPWREIDDVFFETRGYAWALLHQLRAVEHDFDNVLQKKNALVSLRQIIRELEATQQNVWSPMILNGNGFGFVTNHSLVMASYISRANAAVIDLRSLLEQG